jgi:hypothetical protein
MIYLLLYFYYSFLALFENKIKIDIVLKIIITISPLLGLIIFIENIPDYNIYKLSYENIENFNYVINLHMEKLYLVVSWIFYQLGITYHFFRVIVLSIIVTSFSYIIVKLGYKNYFLRFFLLYTCIFITTIFIQYRSGLALMLFLSFGIKYLKYKKKLLFIIIIFILSFIHNSILSMLPLVFLCGIESRKTKLFFLIASIGLIFIYDEIFKLLEYLSRNLLILKKINNYILNSEFYFSNSTLGIRDLSNIFLFIIIVYFIKVSREENIYVWMFFLMIFYRIIFYKTPEVGIRLGFLCQYSVIILIPKLMKKNFFNFIGILTFYFISFYSIIHNYARLF